MKFSEKEHRFLVLGGIDDKNHWTEAEQRGYLRSLTNREKKELDMYDEKSDYCPSCVPTGTKIDAVIAEHGKKCRNCGRLENNVELIRGKQK